jgi:23S rRNA pseudouridine1911/1915/1917 synthase
MESTIKPPVSDTKPVKQPDIPIAYIDEVMLIAVKPAGIPVIPERHDTLKPSLQRILEHTYGRLWVVHRIDRDTSGLVCFARNEDAHKHINEQFSKHTVIKKYLAVVSGRLEGEHGEIDSPIAEHPVKLGVMVINPKGKTAHTSFVVLEQYRTAALLEVSIRTGRTHQIRVHFSSAGHPLLVDPIYGSQAAFYLSSIKKKYKSNVEEDRPTIARLTLHAAALSIVHPVSGELVSVTAPLPHDMETLVKLLRKYGV